MDSSDNSVETSSLGPDNPEGSDNSLEEVDNLPDVPEYSTRGNRTSNHTPDVAEQANRVIITVPFLTWNPQRADGVRGKQDSGTNSAVLLRLLDNINETLCSGDPKIGDIYSRSVGCTVKELLQRHPFLMPRNSQTKSTSQGTPESISQQLFETSQAIFSKFLPDPTPDHVVCRRLWGFIDDIICVGLISKTSQLSETRVF